MEPNTQIIDGMEVRHISYRDPVCEEGTLEFTRKPLIERVRDSFDIQEPKPYCPPPGQERIVLKGETPESQRMKLAKIREEEAAFYLKNKCLRDAIVLDSSPLDADTLSIDEIFNCYRKIVEEEAVAKAAPSAVRRLIIFYIDGLNMDSLPIFKAINQEILERLPKEYDVMYFPTNGPSRMELVNL